MNRLILAEKPSVARNIVDALSIKGKRDGYFEGNGYIVTWAFGHLLTLCDCKDYNEELARWDFNNFPYIPEEFKYKVKPSSANRNIEDAGARKQLNIIKSLVARDDVVEIITATDFDREGELIANLIFSYLQVTKPIKRILINEWTPSEIKKGLDSLKTNEEMKCLQDAGVSRQLADWVIGINFTSVATMKYARGKGNLLNIGRVIMPTLKMIYDREMQIKNFKVEEYFALIGTFNSQDGEYKGRFFHGEKDKFQNKESVEKLKAEIKGREAKIKEKTIETKKEFPPSLFNLSNLQGYVTSKAKGFTADKVLKTAQSLYEKKYITYPRTESTALEESLVDKAKKVLDTLKNQYDFKDEIVFNVTKKVFNNAKVESHSAIIPTYMVPKSLTPDERIVYDAIKNRFISQFMEPAVYEVGEVITAIQGDNYERLFKSKGKILKSKGYLKLYKEDKKDEILPNVEKDEVVEVKSLKVETKKTKPPAHHTEKTLLKAMETCGKNTSSDDEEKDEDILYGFSIGTAATRAETINKLKTAGYINYKGKSLLITEKGERLIETFPIKDLMDTDYTGRLEKKLYDIEKGNFKKEDFLNEIYTFTRRGVNMMKSHRAEIVWDTRG
ncbi:type IA DNA topoisomerase [Clostridium sp.]|uniref:type IA DNA topoisomerase n=1 Tax=Clostridium sp. TaxID=1506 RepID=UPI002FC5BDE6